MDTDLGEMAKKRPHIAKLTFEDLLRICLEAGADDAGFIELGREALSAEREDILRIFPGTQTIVSIVKRANRESLQSPSLAVVDWEFAKVNTASSDIADKIIRSLNILGVRGVAIPPGFPMDITRWPGKIWEVSHKTVAVEAGVGQMGKHRVVIHPRFGDHFLLDTFLIDSKLDRYSRPLDESPCINCGLCISVCPVGAISKDGVLDFMACSMHKYHDLFGNFQEWVEEIVSSKDVRAYRAKFRDRETISRWQSLTYGHSYRCSYCMAVCPAGEETVELYRSGKEDYAERHVKPLKTKREPVYVISGTLAEKVAKGNDSKEVRYVRNTIRPVSVGSFLQGAGILFNPEKAKGLSLTLHFEFTGKEQKMATISISDQKLQVQEGHPGKCNLYIKANSETWIGILNEEISLMKALISRRLKLKGNPALLKKFKSCML